MSPSDIQTSIDHLKRIGFAVFKHPQKDLWDIHRVGRKQYCPSPNHKPWRPRGRSIYYNWDQEPFIYTNKGLIRFAREESSASRQNTTIKGRVKRFDKGKNRTAERNLINSRDLEVLEDQTSHRSPTKTEDVWCWD